ncbi:uncharacterized protein VTP21DRAFT_7499 [Calcarisporiella thermophila]|uniref:uncharacterized protein n=1 Tax=Calcarisporiella thermophila TaxID=911321 RepID=UPI0037426183
MFEKTLTDLIRGIRANKKNEHKYVAACLQEIRQEMRSSDADIKAMAVAKLTYLQMLGYDMSWASFHVVEVMSSPKYFHKRIGYLAAAQSFRQDTDVLMLTTNLIKKDLASSNPLDVGLAINGLSHIVTPDLARDLSQDIVSLLNHSRPYVRKKAVLVLYKVFLRFPEGLRLSFARLKERLEDPDPSVVSAAVNVICELAKKSPKNYLSLAPQLFKLLTTSSNNWMLIKIVKLFGALMPLEPRLSKKLYQPITHLIETTPAMSLLYECIYTVISGGMLEVIASSDPASENHLASICASKLRTYLEDPDQNLKYVGLLAMAKLMETHPKLIAEQKEIILECIDDADISIRLRALDLVVGMVNRRNLTDVVKRLMSHLLPHNTPTPASPTPQSTSTTSEPSSLMLLDPAYRTDIIHRILFICSQNSYAAITSFEWYLAVLVDLTYVAGVNVGEALKAQLMDVGVRVKSVRPFVVRMGVRLLEDLKLLETADNPESNAEVLYAAAWMVGEYFEYLTEPVKVLELLLQPTAEKLAAPVQAVYVHNILKIYSRWASSVAERGVWDVAARDEVLGVTQKIIEGLSPFCRSMDLEVQERACNIREILHIVQEELQRPLTSSHNIAADEFLGLDEHSRTKSPAILAELSSLFDSYELNPVAPKAQRKVPVPEGLDLEAWINEPLPPEVEEENESEGEEVYAYAGAMAMGTAGETKRRHKKEKKSKKGKVVESSDEEERERRRQARKERLRHDPFYIGDGPARTPTPTSTASKEKEREELDVDTIPIVRLTMDEFEVRPKKEKLDKKKGRKKKQELVDIPPPAPVIFGEEEMPEGAVHSDEEAAPTGKGVRKVGASGPGSNSFIWQTNRERDILETDYSGLMNVDLSTPLGEHEKLPQLVAYSSPEEVRRREEERVRQARMEQKTRRIKNGKGEGDEKSKKKKEKPSKNKERPGKTKKKSSKKGEKSASKKSTKTATQATSGVVDFEYEDSISGEVLREDDFLVTYTMKLEKNDSPSDPVIISAIFQAESNRVLRIRLEKTESIQEVEASGTGRVEMSLHVSGASCSRGGQVLAQGSIDVVSPSGETSYHPINIALPPTLFMLHVPPLEPAAFAQLLSEAGESFSFHRTIIFPVKTSPSFSSIEQALKGALEILPRCSRLRIVEIVPGAASLYGQNAFGVHIAGLVKYALQPSQGQNPPADAESSSDTAMMRVDLRGGEEGVLQGLSAAIEHATAQFDR